MSDRPPSIAEVLNFVNSFHEQCRNLVRDTVRLLRDNHKIYLTHVGKWDYAERPSDRFLSHEYSSVRRGWAAFAPSAEAPRGALFHFDFFHTRRFVRPSLMFGSLYAGDSGFEAADRWAAYHAIAAAEKGEATVKVSHEGPIAVVVGTMPKRFEEAALVRVPVETITDELALQRIVVSPLAALLTGTREQAASLLVGVETERWPAQQADSTEVDEDEPEEA